MANEAIREKLLNFLAEKYELNGGGLNELSEFYSLYDLSESDVISTLSHFVQSKYIIFSLDHKFVALTSEGYSVAKPDDVSVKKNGNVNISINESAVAIGGSNASLIKNEKPVGVSFLSSPLGLIIISVLGGVLTYGTLLLLGWVSLPV